MTGTGPAIELRGAGRTFGERVALRPLDLAVERGEVFGLLGPNGSGKTTTLRILATLIRPTAGGASVLSHDVTVDPLAVRRNIGVMPEKPSLYERLTIDDNLRFWAEAHELADPGAAVLAALEFVGLAARREDRAGQLSKGLKQRVALARAIVHRPAVLLLDEPSSGLDPSAAVAMEGMIRDLVRNGATVLMNTHRLAEAERLCDRVAILREGELLEVGTPRQLRSRLLGNVVEVEIAGAIDQPVRRAVESVPGVAEVKWVRGGVSCRLPDAGRDTPELVARLVHAGAKVVSVKQAGDLERVYLELMARGTGQEMGEAA
ncbi:MAG TPA: ABC transporter ATP-binding protein [Tepidiformaceae bacterium]|nr:ABC transporter ATP-binding protein [Tepidiformaceae bacterium]